MLIIVEGEVTVSRPQEGSGGPIRTFRSGDYVGELAATRPTARRQCHRRPPGRPWADSEGSRATRHIGGAARSGHGHARPGGTARHRLGPVIPCRRER